MLSERQIKGTRFEIWLELVLKKTGDLNVKRNILIRNELIQSKNGNNGWKFTRQIDLTFNYVLDNKIYTALVEAKYLDNGVVPYFLRSGEKIVNNPLLPNIDNLVDEVYERQMYSGADLSILVTNQQFDPRIKQHSRRYGIKIVERDDLILLWQEAISDGILNDYLPWKNMKQNMGLEHYIKSINLKDFDLRGDLVKRYN
jgi:hypothetical protein